MANITNSAPISANYVPKFASATSINNSAIYQNGSNIGIGTTTAAVPLEVAGLIQMGGFRLTLNPVAGYVLTSNGSGVGTWSAPGIGGSGTTNFLLKFTGATAAGNSVVSESGGNIGIGTTTPVTKLEVNGTARLGGTVPVPGVYVDGVGNVGIGTAAPTQKLDVNGNVHITGTVQALQSMLALSGLTGRSSSAATPAGVFDNTAGGKILSGQASGMEKFSVDAAGNLTAAGTAQVTGLKLTTGSSNGYVLTSDPSGNASWLAPAMGGTIGGTGTPNAFPMFTDATTIGDSPVYECNSKIGIGIDLPQEELTLAQDSNLATEMQIPSNIAYGFQTAGGLPADDYYFVLSASDGVGWTRGTAELLVTLGSSDHTINLQWSAVVGATKYRVYRALTPGGPYKYIETGETKFDYPNDGLFTTVGAPPTLTTAYISKLSASADSWLLGGKVGIGTATPQSPLAVKGYNEIMALEGSGFTWMSYYPHGRAIPGDLAWTGFGRGNMEFSIVNAVGDIGLIAPNISVFGNLSATQNLNVTGEIRSIHGLCSGSSQRWKTNIQPIHSALQMVLSLCGVSFDWKETGKHDVGLIAEDVGKIIPEIVSYEENGTDALGLDYSRLTAVLIEAIREQQMQIGELKESINSLLAEKHEAVASAI